MKKITFAKFFLLPVGLFLFSFITQAQEANPASGGEAIGSGGTASYTVGQVNYQSENGSNGSVSEGVQQPYEISVTGIDGVSGITLEAKAYPNPTQGDLWLTLEDINIENLSYQMYDYNGKLIISDVIRNNQTLISMHEYASAIYFLQILSDNSKIKTFKIIKN